MLQIGLGAVIGKGKIRKAHGGQHGIFLQLLRADLPDQLIKAAAPRLPQIAGIPAFIAVKTLFQIILRISRLPQKFLFPPLQSKVFFGHIL